MKIAIEENSSIFPKSHFLSDLSLRSREKNSFPIYITTGFFRRCWSIFQRNELLLKTPLSCQMRGFSVFFFILTDHTCHRHCRPFPSVKDYRLQCIRISLSPPWPLFGNIFWHHCSGASPFSNLYLRNLTAKKARLQSMQQIFTEKGTLESHIRTHEQKKTFGCQQCNKYFVHYQCLKSHASVHNTARPFSCKSFQETFKRSQGLRIHMTSHTSTSAVENTYRRKIILLHYVLWEFQPQNRP